MQICCEWCNKEINRSPSALNRINHVFCSRDCRFKFERMRLEAIEDADEKDRISIMLDRELEVLLSSDGV